MPSDEVLKYTIAYYTGILPFCRIKYDVVSLPRLTRDLTAHILSDMRNPKSSLFWKSFLTGFLFIVPVLNVTQEGMIKHLNRRGVTTIYWTLNTDDEIDQVMESSDISCIMTDRPISL